MNILAIGAHPDDVELGCLGTLLEKQKAGHASYAVALAPGGYGEHKWTQIQTVYERVRKMLKGAKGNGDYLLGKFPIGRLQHDWDSVGFVDDLVRTYDIDTIITHHYGEAHQDHLAAQRIAVSAARRAVHRLWLWESSLYTHRNVFAFRPQLYVPISKEAFDRKMEALQAYLDLGLLETGEVEAHRHLARYRGGELRQDYAEAFEVVWELADR